MKEFLDKVFDLSLTMHESLLIGIYGERLGKHLWDKYLDARKDWMRWYGGLDHENRKKIITYIESR